MNNVIAFVQRQYGNYSGRNYDSTLNRLCVHQRDDWFGIQPSTLGVDYNPEPPIFSAKFANCKNYRHIIALANEDGKVALQDTNKQNEELSEESTLEGQQCHFNAVFDLEWVPGEMKFVTASGDHTACLWDIGESKFIRTRIFNGHTRSVKTAAFRKTDQSVFATGGRDGAILIWDTRATLNVDLMPRADNCIYSGHSGGSSTPISQRRRTRHTPKLPVNVQTSSITGLVFQDDNTLVSCGAGDGIIKVWDLRRTYSFYKGEPMPKHSLSYAGTSTFKGFSNLLIDNSGLKLYVNCMDNNIYCYNLATYSNEPIQKYTGLKNGTFYIRSCLSPDGQYLVSGSSDEKAYIWNINNPQPLLGLVGHSVEVTSVAWSATNEIRIITCSDDARHKIWRIGENIEIPADEKHMYRGQAELTKNYRRNLLKNSLKALENTPRSIKRLVHKNENTPNSTEKNYSNKRSFSDMCGIDELENQSGSDLKRTNYETKGRRLFSPSTSMLHSNEHLDLGIDSLQPIMEENELKINNPDSPIKSPTSALTFNKVSPLSERFNLMHNPSEIPGTSSANVQLFSPTTNLPNYVVDGEAPHLRMISPKKKLKENVDWLTKIRKQLLMAGKQITSPSSTSHYTHDPSIDNSPTSGHNVTREVAVSPRLHSLRNVSSKVNCGTPRRRMSRSGSGSESHSKTPKSSRNSSSETILKFLTVVQSHHNMTTATTSQIASTSPANNCECNDINPTNNFD